MMVTGKPAIARMAFKSVVAKDPKRPQGWNNLGKACDDLLLYDEAESHFKRAHRIEPSLYSVENLSTNAVHQCNPDKAIHWAREALKLDPESNPAHINLGFSYLMKGEFRPGWPEYERGLGVTRWRDTKNYRHEPVWDGSAGRNVVVYGEQGIGDQIAFAGAIPEMRDESANLILDVNRKLRGLFERSFSCETHGTMFDHDPDWAKEDPDRIEFSCALSQIQKFYRDSVEKFPAGGYLKADPIRKLQWKTILRTMPNRPKIGIAWTGGVKETQDSARSTSLETFLPFFDLDAEFISLEYKDRSKEIREFERKHGHQVHDYPWATQTADYDDTAALVDELDMVIAVPTSVVHLAGGLGKPCYCIVHEKPHFMFGLSGSNMPFYSSVELFRRKQSFKKPIEQIMERIKNEM
jgi:hypothetical protein